MAPSSALRTSPDDGRSTQPISMSSVLWVSFNLQLVENAPQTLDDPSVAPLLQLYRCVDYFALNAARGPRTYVNKDGVKLSWDYLFRVLISAFAEKVASEKSRRTKEGFFETFHNALIHGQCTLQ